MARHTNFELSAGGLLSQSFGVYFRNLIPFLMLGVLTTAPWVALQIYAESADPRSQTPLSIVSLLVQMLMSQLLTGALCFGVVQQLRGEPAGIGDILSHGLRSLLRVLGSGLLVGLLSGLGLILIVPGIWLMVRFFVAVPVAVMEGKAGGAAMERSSALVRGSGAKIFGVLLLLGIAYMIVLIGAFFLWLRPEMQRGVPPNIPIAFTAVLSVFGGTFYSTLMSVAYFQLRMGKENVDAGQVAAIFG